MDLSDMENEIVELRKLLQKKEDDLLRLRGEEMKKKQVKSPWEIVPRWAVERYSRQALLSELGPARAGLALLMGGSVLVVGAGGLGCPAAAYLTGAGIGHIGIVDYDEVELSNIHRQLLHSECSVGISKVDSAAISMRRINSNVAVTPYKMQMDSSNAMNVIRRFDIVLDATDNVATRYLLNDACVLLGKPLVSASALKMEGQFTIYNHYYSSNVDEKGPCLRCVFPEPPPPETVGSCSQSGVLGPVPGLLGCLMAIETIKILLNADTCVGHLLLFDAADTRFRKVKLRSRNPNCAVCSENPTITELINYPEFCNAQASDKDLKLNILKSFQRISPIDYFDIAHPRVLEDYCQMKNIDLSAIDETGSKLLEPESPSSEEISLEKFEGKSITFDVRSKREFELCKLDGTINISMDNFEKEIEKLAKFVDDKKLEEVFFICRRGNDSQVAVQKLNEKFRAMFPSSAIPNIRDIEGGLHDWAKTVDCSFPIY